jgi:hypothetical protein
MHPFCLFSQKATKHAKDKRQGPRREKQKRENGAFFSSTTKSEEKERERERRGGEEIDLEDEHKKKSKNQKNLFNKSGCRESFFAPLSRGARCAFPTAGNFC